MNQPTTRDALILFAVFVLVSVVFGEVNRRYFNWKPTTAIGLIYLLFFSHIIGIVLPILVYLKAKKYNLKETLSIRPVTMWTMIKVMFLSLIFLVLLSLLQGLMEPLFEPFKNDMAEYQNFYTQIAGASTGKLNMALLILAISIVPAFAEEMLFRGVMLSGFSLPGGAPGSRLEGRNSSNAVKAIILTGLLFGLMHSFPPQIIAISLMGIFFGTLVVKTKSILVSIWAHFLHNFIMVLVMLMMPFSS